MNTSPERDHLEAAGRVAARFPQRWLRAYVGTKLRTDPVYAAVYELLHESTAPILDVGCGIGLLGFYLRERGLLQAITGLDRDARKVRYAAAVAEPNYSMIEFREHDVKNETPTFRGNIAILDLLHYLSPSRQRRLLTELAERVVPGGVLLIRDCPRDPNPRYWATLLAEKFAQAITWNIASSLHFPSRQSVREVFAAEKFSERISPLWGATPFNNHLFVFRRN
ncbi:MAG: class I SAM-dependent methyltransferase [Chthoniobacterales bacterium]